MAVGPQFQIAPSVVFPLPIPVDPTMDLCPHVLCTLRNVSQPPVLLLCQMCRRISRRLFAQGEEINKLKTALNAINENT